MKNTYDSRFHKELNFRDLGGYHTSDGRTVKKNLFYRSGSLCYMTPAELDVFKSLGIKCIIDLRTENENRKHPDPELPGIQTYRCSGVVSKGGEGIDFSPKGMNKTGRAGEEQIQQLSGYYKEMPFHNEAFMTMMQQIKQDNVPMCIHCATGKDRTGVAAMILLAMLGVDEETVLADYLLSCEYRKAILEETLNENAERIKEHPVLKDLLTMKEGVSSDIGRMVLNSMYHRYGSFEKYLLYEYGINDDQLKEIRDRYLEGSAR